MTQQDIYLEISGRASGKTRRILQAIIAWLDSSSLNIAILSLPNHNQYLRTLSTLDGSVLSPRIFQTREDAKNQKPDRLGYKYKYFYDELDYFNEVISYPNDGDIYAVTTPSKIRIFDKLDDNDNLINLLKLTNGKYTSYSMIGNNFLDKEIFNDLLESTDKKIINKEYLANWIKI